MRRDQYSIIQGRILRVDLGSGKIWIDNPPEKLYNKYLGGRALALYYLLKELPLRADPLGPDNVLICAAGLLNGIPGPGVPKFTVAAKSPLTGGIGESEAGGFWGPELRLCGWDAVVIQNKAPRPVFLVILDQEVHLEEASELWELDTKAFQRAVQSKYKKAKILQIGTAGVHGVRFANLVNDLCFFNGRNGLGAVMGAKNLRGIVVQSSRRTIQFDDTDQIRSIARQAAANARTNVLSVALNELGTAGGISSQNAGGALPSFNWKFNVFEAAAEIGGEKLCEYFLQKRHGCFACPIRCKRVVEVNLETLKVDPAFGGPEYESLASLGSLCGIDDLAAVCKANELCNRYGMDTISAGATIAFAMQCFEEGIIGIEEVGYDLSFGNAESLLRMLEEIAYRKGFGAILADGSFRAAQQLGRGAEAFCHHVKKQELPLHDARVKTGMALQYAVSPRGADHWVAQHDPFFKDKSSPGIKELFQIGLHDPVAPEDLGPQKVRLFYITHMLCSVYDILGVCALAAVARSVITLEQILLMAEAATGRKMSWFELLQCGERANNMARLFNLREGFDQGSDTLPAIFTRNIEGGPREGSGAINVQIFQGALILFYQMSGWGETGIPLRGKIEEMGLTEFLDQD